MILTELRHIQKIMKDILVVGQATILYLTIFSTATLWETIMQLQHYEKQLCKRLLRNNSLKKLENENNNEGHIGNTRWNV